MGSAEDKSGYVKVCDFFEIVLQIVKVDLYVRIYIIRTCSNGGTYSELGAIKFFGHICIERPTVTFLWSNSINMEGF